MMKKQSNQQKRLINLGKQTDNETHVQMIVSQLFPISWLLTSICSYRFQLIGKNIMIYNVYNFEHK